MSKNNRNNDVRNQIGRLLTDLVLPERVSVVSILSKEWSEKLTISRETKMHEIINYLMQNNVDFDKLTLACDCAKVLRPEPAIMQEIKPVAGFESMAVQDLGVTDTPDEEPQIVEDTVVRTQARSTGEPVNDNESDPYAGLTFEEITTKIDEEFYKDKPRLVNDAASTSNGAYWLAAGAAAIGAIAYGGYKVFTRTPSH